MNHRYHRCGIITLLICCLPHGLAAVDGSAVNGDPCSRVFPGQGMASWRAEAEPVWRVPMRYPSGATPVIVGDAVFTCDEPGTLICVDAASGEERWRREVTAAALLPSGEADALRQILETVTASWGRGEGEHDAPPAVRDQRESLWKHHGIAPILNERYRYYGYTSTDALSDGEQVYIVNGTCTASAFTLDGDRRWMVRFTDQGKVKPTIRASQSVLIGDRLIIKVWPKGRTENAAVCQLMALHTATGKELWRSAEFQCADHGEWGGQAIVTVAGRQLVVTPGGRIFDPADGSQLIEGLGNCGHGMSPATAGDVVMFGKSCVRLTFAEAGSLQATPALEVKSFGCTPIIAHGRGYVVSPKGGYIFDVSELDGRKPRRVKWQAPGEWPRKLRLAMCTPSVIGDTGLMAFDDSRLAAWRLQATPELLWVQEITGLNKHSAPASDGARVFLRRSDGLVAWDL